MDSFSALSAMGSGTIFLSLLSIITLFSHVTSSPKSHVDFFNCLQYQKSSFNTSTIYARQNPSYTNMLDSAVRNLLPQSQNTSRSPEYIITPLNESEIQAVVFCSKTVGILMKVRSGGHDYEGLSYISQIPFVIVDLRNFGRITFDSEAKTAWVGAGSTLGELYHAISEEGDSLAFVAGACPTVGVGGHFSGGGYSMMSRNFGISADNVIDARIIDVNGQVLDRNAMGEDLFWALRGGGAASFGIVTAWKIQLLSVPEKVTTFSVTRTVEENATELVHLWQSIGNTIDRKLVMKVLINSISSTTSPINRTISVTFLSMYVGRVEDLLPIMQKSFPQLGLVKGDCSEMTWIESTLFFANINPKERFKLLDRTSNKVVFFKGKSDFVTNPISKEELEGIWQKLHQEKPDAVRIQFSPFGGKISEIPDSEIPFPHRNGTLFMIHYSLGWVQVEESKGHILWIEDFSNYLADYVSQSPRRAYQNYRDLDLGSNSLAGKTSYQQASQWARRYFNI